MNKTVRLTLIALACSAAVAACSKKQEVKPVTATPTPTTQTMTSSSSSSTGFTPADLETNACLRQRTVYFDFNKSVIKPQFEAAMRCQAKYLVDRPSAHVRLQGNTDERGSREYNLGLGERRADAVAAALEANGASASQITTISYGEEQPVCREHNETCWAKNRRVNIVYTSK